MWCPQCKIETTVAGSRSSTEARCGACGNPLQSSKGSDSTIRQARDIVAKWSSSDLLDQISALPALPPMPRPHFPKLEDAAAAKRPETESKSANSEQSSQRHTARTPEQQTAPPEQPEAVDFVFDDDIDVDDATTNDTTSDATIDATEIMGPQPAAEVAAVHPDSDQVGDEVTDADNPSAESEPAIARQPPQSAAENSPATITDQQGPAAEPSSQPKMTLIATLKPDGERQDKQHSESKAVATEAGVSPKNVNPTAADRAPAATSPADEPAVIETARSVSAPDETRRPQQRASQPREARERTSVSRHPAPDKNSKPAAALNEGPKTVTRNLRVDRPGQEDGEPVEASSDSKNVAGARIQSNSSGGGGRRRIDSGVPATATLETGDRRVRTQQHPRRRYIDEPHDTAVRGPHFQVTAPKRSNITSLTGQFLAYLGVLGLTIGTAIVIYGHFGGYSDYTPTGWLVTTVAQMMLFLGVINLVSGGIEQTNDDVSARINTLGEQLLRIEQVTEEVLRGPKISPRRYANPDSDIAEHERELVPVPVRERD